MSSQARWRGSTAPRYPWAPPAWVTTFVTVPLPGPVAPSGNGERAKDRGRSRNAQPVVLRSSAFIVNHRAPAALLAVALASPFVPLSGAASAAGPSYTLTDIGPVGGSAHADAISPNGTVVGDMTEAGGTDSVPFIWRNGVLERLALPAGYGSGLALGVNDAGTVVGGVNESGGRYRAVIWTSGVPSFLGPIDSLAFGVNAGGVVVGRSQDRSVRWISGAVSELGAASDPPAQAEGINDAGVAVGALNGPALVPSVWRDGARSSLPLPESATAGEAYTINRDGVIAGWTMSSGISKAVVWDAAGVHVLATLAGFEQAVASSVNTAGDVVGIAYGEAGNRAVIWRARGAAVDLNSLVTGASGWGLTDTFQIDEAGRIVGFGTHDGVQRGYILTPARTSYIFDGFKQPVDNGVLNQAVAGQTVPLKFTVRAADGSPVTNLTTFTLIVRSLSCDRGVTPDLIEEYWVGSAGLNNLGGGDYVIGWKTPKSYAASCKTLVLALDDGVEHTAAFVFTR
jgi:uncharacterized membrane protein